MKKTDREIILFSETDLLRMGMNRHDAKYVLKWHGIQGYHLDTKRDFISRKSLEKILTDRHLCLIENGNFLCIVKAE